MLVGIAMSLAPWNTGTAAAEDSLPACSPDGFVEGLAVRWYDNGDFKVSLTPTAAGRSVATWKLYHLWHMVQACVPGLVGNTADRIYAQLACHADLSLVPSPTDPSGFQTGATFDLESWKAPDNEIYSTVTLCSSDSAGYGAEHDAGSWEVYYGPHPDPDQGALDNAPSPEQEPAAVTEPGLVTVRVAFTGGVGLWARTGPGYGAELLTVLPEGTEMRLRCQVRSEMIDGWISSDLWDQVELADGSVVWVSDVYVETGSNDAVAEAC